LRDATPLNEDGFGEYMDVFALLKANQSMELLKPSIEFEGFGLTFSAPKDEIESI
jgi:hypothetical protein